MIGGPLDEAALIETDSAKLLAPDFGSPIRNHGLH
jgi:hypothetical protein